MKETEVWKEVKKARLLYDYFILSLLSRKSWLDLTLILGRKFLPKLIRHWLWGAMGENLYYHSLKKKYILRSLMTSHLILLSLLNA